MKKKLEMSEEEAIIEYPNASPAIKAIFESTFGKYFANKKMSDRIQTFSDILNILKIEDVPPYSRSNLTPLEKSINAQWRATKIAEAYNEGKVLDFNNTNQSKYFIYSVLYGVSRRLFVICWSSSVFYPAGLAFYNLKDAEDAKIKFKRIYEDFLMVK